MKTAIVTGAGGFIGRSLVSELVSRHIKVYAVDIYPQERETGPPKEGVIPIRAGFEQYESLTKLIPEKVDVFFHFAWKGVSGGDYREIAAQTENIAASGIAIQQAIKLGCDRFIFAGSSHEYLRNPDTCNDAFPIPSIYGAAKYSVEQMGRIVAGNQLSFISVMFTNVFGIGDYSHRSTNVFLRQLLAGEDLHLISGEHQHDWTYITDAVEGVIAAAERGKRGRQYYIGRRKLMTFREIIEVVRSAISPQSKLKYGEYSDNSYVDYTHIDLDALYNDTGFECQANFRESILKTADWVKTLDW